MINHRATRPGQGSPSHADCLAAEKGAEAGGTSRTWTRNRTDFAAPGQRKVAAPGEDRCEQTVMMWVGEPIGIRVPGFHPEHENSAIQSSSDGRTIREAHNHLP